MTKSYPVGTILRSGKQYYVVSGTSYAIPGGTAYIYTNTEVSTPLEEVSYSVDLPIWTQILHFATQDVRLWKTVEIIHSKFLALYREGTVSTEEKIPRPIYRTGKEISVTGNVLPRSYEFIVTTSTAITSRDISAMLLSHFDTDPTMKYVTANMDTLTPNAFSYTTSTPMTEELLTYYLYGKVKGYEVTSSTIPEDLVPYLLSLIVVDCIAPQGSTIESLRASGVFSGIELPHGLLHALHRLVPILKLKRSGSHVA